MKPSNYILFVRKISGKNWSKYKIRTEFNKQVDKGDYDPKDIDELHQHLFGVTKSTA